MEVQGCGAGSRFCSVSLGVPPHRVQLPGENVDRSGAGPRAPPPSGALIDWDPLRWKAGCSVWTSPAHTLGRQHLRGYSYYCTLFATFRSKIPLPTPTMPCALKGPQEPPGGGDGERLKGNAEPSASAIALLPLPGGVGVHPRPRPRVGRGSFVEEKGPFFHL